MQISGISFRSRLEERRFFFFRKKCDTQGSLARSNDTDRGNRSLSLVRDSRELFWKLSTYQKDKFKAIKGLARRISRRNLKDTFFYGSWKQSIQYGLLCSSISGGNFSLATGTANNPPHNQNVPLIPPWSWACVEKPVHDHSSSGNIGESVATPSS